MSDLIDVEKYLLLRNSVSKHKLRSEIEENTNEDYDIEGCNVENELNDKFNRCKDLVGLYGEAVFCYDEDSELIEFDKKFRAREEYLLCISAILINDGYHISEYFEKITAEAIKSYLGDNTKYKFIDILKKSCDFERFCNEELHEKPRHDANKTFRHSDNIRSDIIVWKPLDQVGGKIILLVECKSGQKWKKGFPVNIDMWKNLIEFGAQPIKVFAIADLLVDNSQETLGESSEKGFILDRVRLIRLLANSNNKEIESIRSDIKKLKLEDRIQV